MRHVFCVQSFNFHIFPGNRELFDESLRDEYMKPGLEYFNGFADMKPTIDTDLDGEICADQLHSLLQRNAMATIQPPKSAAAPSQPTNKKRTESEMVLDKIHGVEDEDMRRKPLGIVQPRVHVPHRGGAFEGFVDGPKTHRQSVSYQVIRRPDGMIKTKTVVDPDGTTKTIIQRTENGETKTQTLINGIDVKGDNDAAIQPDGTFEFRVLQPQPKPWIVNYGRHIAINKDGYALPKNLW